MMMMAGWPRLASLDHSFIGIRDQNLPLISENFENYDHFGESFFERNFVPISELEYVGYSWKLVSSIACACISLSTYYICFPCMVFSTFVILQVRAN